jgi:EAL domain-containing protein (putative c-di-GMP-specific phosphodiesterase class I)
MGVADPAFLPFRMALQPVVNAGSAEVVAYEALVRGPAGEGADFVLDRVTARNRFAFDQSSRTRALELAVRLGLAETGITLSVNFLAGAVRDPASWLHATLEDTDRYGFPPGQMMFEIVETDPFGDYRHLKSVLRTLREHGFRVAIDDFGAGYTGLAMLSHITPDFVKLDMRLIQGIDRNPIHQALVRGIHSICGDLGIGLIAEGVETTQERAALEALGVVLFQGFLFARPGLEMLPAVAWQR